MSAALGIVTPYALLALGALPYGYRAHATLKKHFSNSMLLAPALASTIKAHMYAGLLLYMGYVLAALT